jgi:PucR family transcriptional regulator, proline-responsive transcriptional activator
MLSECAGQTEPDSFTWRRAMAKMGPLQMNVSLEMVADALKKYAPEVHLSIKDQFVETATLLNTRQAAFEPEILYVGKASELGKIPSISSPLNLLCVSGTPLPQEYHDLPGLNLITVSDPVDIAVLLQEVKNLLSVHHQTIQGSLKLLNALISGKGFQHILDIAYEILGNPLFAVDAALKLLGYANHQEVKDTTWQRIIGDGYVPPDLAKALDSLGEIKKLADNDVPQITGHPLEHYRLESRIATNNKVFGFMAMIEYDKPIEEKDRDIFRLLGNILACEMQKESFFSNAKGFAFDFLIADLLNGKTTNSNVIQERIATLAWKFNENLYLLTVRDVNESQGNPALFYLKILLEEKIRESKSVLYKDRIVLLIGRDKKKPLANTELNGIIATLQENHLVGGVSRCFHNLADIQDYYNQSSAAIELGLRLDKAGVLFYYDDYAFFHMMELAGNQRDLKSFCDPAIFQLIDYDVKNNTHFTRSLYEYLLSGNNSKESAYKLGVHRNTMDYRIQKIRETLNMDIDDPKVTWSLHLSFKILELLGKTDFL